MLLANDTNKENNTYMKSVQRQHCKHVLVSLFHTINDLFDEGANKEF